MTMIIFSVPSVIGVDETGKAAWGSRGGLLRQWIRKKQKPRERRSGLPMVFGLEVAGLRLRLQTFPLGRRPKIKAVPKGKTAKAVTAEMHPEPHKRTDVMLL
jgi:hypothetical protein